MFGFFSPFGPATRYGRSGFGLGRPLALGLTLVVLFLAAGQSQFAFHDSAFQIHLRGNQREALLTRLSQKFVDLAAVQQKLAIANRRVVVAVAV